jgi:hypothetical protein
MRAAVSFCSSKKKPKTLRADITLQASSDSLRYDAELLALRKARQTTASLSLRLSRTANEATYMLGQRFANI